MSDEDRARLRAQEILDASATEDEGEDDDSTERVAADIVTIPNQFRRIVLNDNTLGLRLRHLGLHIHIDTTVIAGASS